MSGWIIIIGLIISGGLAAAAYTFAPKGPNQVVLRTSFIYTIITTYLMWAVTYLAQLHPLIQPRRSDLRPEFAE